MLYLSLDMPPRAVFPIQTSGSALSITCGTVFFVHTQVHIYSMYATRTA